MPISSSSTFILYRYFSIRCLSLLFIVYFITVLFYLYTSSILSRIFLFGGGPAI